MSLAAITEPGALDWCLQREASFAQTITLTQDGSAIDLTGYSVTAPIVDARGESLGAFTAAVVAPATAGQVSLALPVTSVADLPVRSRWYLKLSLIADPDNNTHIVLKGAVVVNEPSAEVSCC